MNGVLQDILCLLELMIYKGDKYALEARDFRKSKLVHLARAQHIGEASLPVHCRYPGLEFTFKATCTGKVMLHLALFCKF